jgi:hypothetical protein
MTLQSIIAELPNLKEQELKLVKAAIEELLQPEEPSVLYTALCRTVKQNLPFDAFARSRAFSRYKLNEKLVLEFVRFNWPDLSQVREQGLLCSLLQLLVGYLGGKNIPVSIGTVALNLHQLPTVVEQAFPGYLAAGLGPLLLQTLVPKHERTP